MTFVTEEEMNELARFERSDHRTSFAFGVLYSTLMGFVLGGVHMYFFLTVEAMGHVAVPSWLLSFTHMVTAVTCFVLATYVLLPRPRRNLLLVGYAGAALHFCLWTMNTFVLEGHENVTLLHLFLGAWMPFIAWMTGNVVGSILTVRNQIDIMKETFLAEDEHQKTA
eukprot:PhM_4_TR14073/c0_g4_i1/m.60733